MECRCIQDLSECEKKSYVARYFDEAHLISKCTEVIIIFSKLNQTIGIVINKVPFYIKKGYNKICLCNVSKTLNWALGIAANYLCRLEKVEYSNNLVEVYILKAYNHKLNCINNIPPSLKELTYFSLFLQNIGGYKLERLYKEGNIPKVLYENRQRIKCHLEYFESSCVHCQTGPTKIPSCSNPGKHVKANPVGLPGC